MRVAVDVGIAGLPGSCTADGRTRASRAGDQKWRSVRGQMPGGDRGRRLSFGRGWILIRPDAKRSLAVSVAVGWWCRSMRSRRTLPRFLPSRATVSTSNLLGLNAALAQMQDKKAVRAIIERVTNLPMAPRSRFRKAHAAFNAGDTLSAMTRIDQALALRSD